MTDTPEKPATLTPSELCDKFEKIVVDCCRSKEWVFWRETEVTDEEMFEINERFSLLLLAHLQRKEAA